MPRHASCGLDLNAVPDIKAALSIVSENGFMFTCLPVVHPRYKREFLLPESLPNMGAFTRSDLMLSSQDWSNMVVGKLSDHWDCDSDDVSLRKQSEGGIIQEMMFASHLNLPAVILPLHGTEHTNLARIVYDRALHHHNCNPFWVKIPMVSPEVEATYFRQESEPPEISTWHWWNGFRLICNSDKRLNLLLEVSTDLPDPSEIDRWFGEPLKALLLSTKLFLTNKKGYPVLSPAHQAVVKRAAGLELQVVLTGTNRHTSLKHYVQYIDYLYQNRNGCGEGTTPYSRGYEDHLQIPLQPLMDNLESSTYEIFEKDPVKYTEYQRAIYQALLDRVPEEEAETNVQVIMVVGAGRGPLVTSSIMAAESAKRCIRVYAVEKNPNACVTLFAMKEEVWKDTVEVVAGDMRDWRPPELCDILVSELLGSFGDNELSPECLDGPEKYLKGNGISVPSWYCSYISPLQSSKLYNEAKNSLIGDKKHYARFEMPYVVHQVNTYNLAPPQPVFQFFHPKSDENEDHRRYKRMSFVIEQDSVLHGFTGYFEAILYKDIKLSIVPDTYSKGMFSWFPIYFPIKEPVQLKKGDTVVAHFWRLADRKFVWYEWTISEPVQMAVHNPNGRSYNIGLF